MKRFDFLTGTFEVVADDDLFGPEQAVLIAPVRIVRVTCRVCEKPAQVPVDAPAKLCDLCGEDAHRTARHVRDVYARAFWRCDEVWARFNNQVQLADTATHARWDAYQDAIDAHDPRVAETERLVRGGVAGPFASLVRAYLEWRDAVARVGEVLAWQQAALAELEAHTPGAGVEL